MSQNGRRISCWIMHFPLEWSMDLYRREKLRRKVLFRRLTLPKIMKACRQIIACRLFTEMEGFEPSRRRTDLPDFESGPFSHLGTSPEHCILYENASHVIDYTGNAGAFQEGFLNCCNIYESTETFFNPSDTTCYIRGKCGILSLSVF